MRTIIILITFAILLTVGCVTLPVQNVTTGYTPSYRNWVKRMPQTTSYKLIYKEMPYEKVIHQW
jgi:hypothetical protein